MDTAYVFTVVGVIAVTAIYFVCVRKLSPTAKQPQSASESHTDRQ